MGLLKNKIRKYIDAWKKGFFLFFMVGLCLFIGAVIFAFIFVIFVALPYELITGRSDIEYLSPNFIYVFGALTYGVYLIGDGSFSNILSSPIMKKILGFKKHNL